MNIKLLLGIFIPLIVIILLIVLSSGNIGFSVEKETEKSVLFNSLFVNQYQPRDNIQIQTITLNNDYFMSRKFELPRLIVCLSDKEGVKQRENIQVRYSEGKYSTGSDVPIFEDLYYDSYAYYSSTQSIEVAANGKKQVKILIEPKYLYDYQNINNYKEYDELLLIQTKGGKRYGYNSCLNLESRELESAARIDIVEKPAIISGKTSPTVIINPNVQGIQQITKRDISECNNVYGIQKDSCLQTFAIGTHNTEVCELILTPSYKDSCYSGIASTSGNLSICERVSMLGNAKDYCIANTAIRLKDNVICNNIQEEGIKKYCLTSIG